MLDTYGAKDKVKNKKINIKKTTNNVIKEVQEPEESIINRQSHMTANKNNLG